jgi:outer membrane lipopolysaccharide assembly protein LptE/RlpB
MNMHRIGAVALAAACITGLAGCGKRALSDTQLTQLLRTERAMANDPNAPLDANAIDCLRAWSGDLELTAALSPSVNSDMNRKACRQRLDNWLADATRNPGNVTFEQAATPASIRRAQALLLEHRAKGVAGLPSAADRQPGQLAARTPAPAAPATTSGAMPAGTVDVKEATDGLAKLDQLCARANQSSSGANETVVRFAGYCERRNEQMRSRITSIQQRGDARSAQMMNDAVTRALAAAQKMFDQPQPSNGQ